MKLLTKAILFATTIVTANVQASNEPIAMACTLTNGKNVIVGVIDGQWRYYFGKSDKPEMTIVGERHFKGDVEETTKGTATQIRVTNGEYNYVLYSAAFTNGESNLLGVFKGDKQITSMKCKGSFVINYNLVNQLPTDPDSYNFMPF